MDRNSQDDERPDPIVSEPPPEPEPMLKEPADVDEANRVIGATLPATTRTIRNTRGRTIE